MMHLLDFKPAGGQAEAGARLSLQVHKVRRELQHHRSCLRPQAGIVHCRKVAQLLGCKRLRLRGRLSKLQLAPAAVVSLEPDTYCDRPEESNASCTRMLRIYLALINTLKKAQRLSPYKNNNSNSKRLNSEHCSQTGPPGCTAFCQRCVKQCQHNLNHRLTLQLSATASSR